MLECRRDYRSDTPQPALPIGFVQEYAGMLEPLPALPRQDNNVSQRSTTELTRPEAKEVVISKLVTIFDVAGRKLSGAGV
jgi:hypothetical protein